MIYVYGGLVIVGVCYAYFRFAVWVGRLIAWGTQPESEGSGKLRREKETSDSSCWRSVH